MSGIDVPGKPFHDPEADHALFEALEKTVRQGPQRQVIRVAGRDQRSGLRGGAWSRPSGASRRRVRKTA